MNQNIIKTISEGFWLELLESSTETSFLEKLISSLALVAFYSPLFRFEVRPPFSDWKGSIGVAASTNSMDGMALTLVVIYLVV